MAILVRRIQRNGGSYCVVIPRAMMALLELKRGDQVVLAARGKHGLHYLELWKLTDPALGRAVVARVAGRS